jgi:hypothetical protein
MGKVNVISHFSGFRAPRKSIGRIILAASLLLTLVGAPSASHADSTFGGYLAYSAENKPLPSDLYQLLNGQYMTVSVQPTDLATITFAGYFDSSLPPDSFMAVNGRSPLMRLRIYSGSTVGTPLGNVTMEAPSTIYSGTASQPAIAYSIKDVSQGSTSSSVSLAACSPKTWLNNNAIYFSILRSCSGMPDYFFASMYIESNIYNSTTLRDYKSFPETPSFFDLRSVPKPPKRDQTITINQQSDVTLETRQIYVQASTSSGLPYVITTTTPAVCAPVGNTNNISLLTPGTCSLNFFAVGNSDYLDSKNYATSFTVIAPKVNQTIQYNFPALTMDSPNPSFSAPVTSAGLAVQLSLSQDNGVCRVNSATSLTLLSSGTCSLLLYSPGDSTRNPVQQVVNLYVQAAKVKQNIYWNQPTGITVDMGYVTLEVSADSGNQPTITSQTPSVCQMDPNTVSDVVLRGVGTCVLSFQVDGNDRFLSFGPATASFIIGPKPPVAKPTPTPTKKPTTSGTKTATPTPTPTPSKVIVITAGKSSGGQTTSGGAAQACLKLTGGCKTATPTPTPTKKK